MELALISSRSTQSTGSKKSLTNWKLIPKSIIPRPEMKKAPSFRMIQRYPSKDFSLSDPNFDHWSSGSDSDEDDDSGFKAVDKTKGGFELTRSISDPGLKEKMIEMRRSQPRRASMHTTNTNTISWSELDLHKKSRSTFSEKDDSRRKLSVDFFSSQSSFVWDSFVWDDKNDLSSLAASSSPASESKSYGGLLDRKLTRRKSGSSTNGSYQLCKDNSFLSLDTKTTLGSTGSSDDNESTIIVVEEEMVDAWTSSFESQNESLPALPIALNKIDESFSERSTRSAVTIFSDPWEDVEHSATILKPREEQLLQELANSKQDADALRPRLSGSLQELARISGQEQQDQQLAPVTFIILTQLKCDRANSMSQKLLYKKEMERSNSQLLEQANITSTSLAEELKAAQKLLAAAEEEEMTLRRGALKRKQLDEQRSKKLDEREEQLNQREAQVFREQKACLEQLRLAEEQGEQMEASLQKQQAQIKTRLGMQNETLQKKQERLENQIKAHQQIVEEWQEREKSASSRLEDWGKQLVKKEITLRNQDSELKKRTIILKSQAHECERVHHNAVDKLEARVNTFEKADEEFRRTKSQYVRLGVVANSQILQAKDSELATLKQKVKELESMLFFFEQQCGEMLLGEEGETSLNDERDFNPEEAEEISQLKKVKALKSKLRTRSERKQAGAMSKQRGAIIQHLEQDLESNELGCETTSSAGYSFLINGLDQV